MVREALEVLLLLSQLLLELQKLLLLALADGPVFVGALTALESVTANNRRPRSVIEPGNSIGT